VAAAAAAQVAAAVPTAERRGLAERLRMGSLLDDGLSYKESFVVRSYEVGINKTATVETIANLLQVPPPPPPHEFPTLPRDPSLDFSRPSH
jgi:fatty acyl-ACP thioesterase A